MLDVLTLLTYNVVMGAWPMLKKLWPALAIVAALNLLSWIASWAFGGRGGFNMVTSFAVLLPFLYFMWPMREAFDEKKAPLDPELTDQVAEMTRTVDTRPVQVHVLTGSVGKREIATYAWGDALFVTKAAVDTLSSNGLRWMLAQQLGRTVRARRVREEYQRSPFRRVSFGVGAVVLLVSLVALGHTPHGLHTWLSGGGIAIAVVILLLAKTEDPLSKSDQEPRRNQFATELVGEDGEREVMRVLAEQTGNVASGHRA